MHSLRHVFLSVVGFALLTVSLVAVAQVPLQFVPVTPCRVVDTRWLPNGPFSGPAIQGQTSRDFAIPNGACSIPNTAAAYSLNIAVVPRGGLGYLTVWPAGQPRPVLATLNSVDGRIKANAAIIPAGSGEAISVYATQTTDVVLDIDGYFAPASSSTLAFFPLTPCRVADTRWTTGPLGGPFLTGLTERIFPVLSSSCNIPNSAEAYSLNFAAIPHGPLGYMTVWPTGQSKPLVSTLNALTGTITANAALVPSGLSGAISVFPSNDTDLVIDVDGYFAAADSAPGPLSMYNLTPCRVLDTRQTIGAFSGKIGVGVLQSACAVPSAQAYVLNATVVPQNGQPLGYLTLWPDAEGRPVVATLNALDGAITNNMAIVPTLNGSIDAYATNPTNLVLDIFSYFAPITSLGITTTSLPSGTLSFSYSTTLGGSGGVPPYTWSVTAGDLPPGLDLDPTSGALSGIPTVAGTYPFTVQVADSQSPPATASAPLSITVNATLTQLTVVTTSLPGGTQNTAYSAMLAATGGLTPYTWSVTAGSLPVGLHLNASSGAITGTPSGGGTSNFTVQVADANLPPSTASAQLSITISPAVPLSITTTFLPSGNAGIAYSATLVAIGGVYPYTWSLTSGSLPNGLSLNSSTGTIAGTPTTPGTSNFTVQVADSETPPVTASAPLSVVINPGGSGNPGALTGNYAFYLNGFNSSGAWTLAGSFISDGNGHITSGVVDGNSVTGQPFNTTISGTYWIAANGLNTITIQGQSYGPVTFAFVLDSSANGRIIEYDDTTGQGSRGSGVLRKADPTAFSLSRLNGGYVFGMTGADNSALRFVDVGVFTLASGNITNGACDVNDGGTFQTCTFSGSVTTINAQTGRGLSTTVGTFGTTHQAVYVVSPGEMVMEQIDSISGTQAPLLVGSVLQQTGSFSNATLNGTAVMYMQDIHEGDGLDQSQAGIISFDGHGNYNVTAFDEDLAGTIQQGQTFQGTYTVQSNGAFVLTQTGKTPFPGFLVGQNKAMMVGEGNSTIFAIMEPQTGGPFSNASIAGTYAGGTLPPLDYAKSRLEVDTGSSDGVGTLTLSDDSSKDGGLGQNLGQAIGYTVAANGRGTSVEQPPAVIYVISPTKVVVLLPEDGAEVVVLAH
jgi:Putative Ig domain